MASVYTDLYCTTGADAQSGQLSITADIAASSLPDDDALEIDATVDFALGEAAAPLGLTAQCAGIVIKRNGALIEVASLMSVEVQRDYDNNLQQWSLSVTLRDADGPFGNPFSHAGPALCKDEITIYGAYYVGNTTYLIPLIKDGIADAAQRSTDSEGVETINGVDHGGFFDQKLIDFVIPIGSGLDRAKAIELIAKEALEDEWIDLPSSDRPMMKEVQIADAQFLGPCQELADVENRRLLWNREGAFTWVKVGRQHEFDRGTRGTIDERRWVRGSVSTEHPGGEVVTRIIADGDAQVPGDCETVEVTQTITIKGMDGPQRQLYRQTKLGDGSGQPTYEALDPLGAWTDPQVVSVEVITRKEKCKTLLFERNVRWEYYNPEALRWEWDHHADPADSEWDAVTPGILAFTAVYTNDNGTPDSNEPALYFDRPRWMIVSINETWHSWFQNGFEARIDPGQGNYITPRGSGAWFLRPINADIALMSQDRLGNWVGPYAGVKIGTLFRSWGWNYIAAKVKDRDTTYPYATWEETEPVDGTQVTGDKRAVASDSLSFGPSVAPPYEGLGMAESFTCIEQRATWFESNENGYLTGIYEDVATHRARAGNRYMYGDGLTYDDEYETFGFNDQTITQYVAAGDASHDEIVSRYGRDGTLYESVSSTGLDGYLPAAERMPGEASPQDDLYDDEDQADETFIPSMRTDTKPISVEIEDIGLENCHVENKRQLNAPYAENEDELEEMAWAVIDESAAATVTGTVAGADFFIEPGDLYLLKHGKIGLNHVGRIKSVRWRWSPSSPGEPINTEITARVYHQRSS